MRYRNIPRWECGSFLRRAMMPAVCVVFSFAPSVLGAERNFDGDTDSDWNIPANWSGNSLPGAGDRARISDAVSQVTMTSSPASAINSMWIGSDAAGNGTGKLFISGGAFLDVSGTGGTGTNGRVELGRNNDRGDIEMSGATTRLDIAEDLYIGQGNNNSALNSIVTINDGILNVTGRMAVGYNKQGRFELIEGTATIDGGLVLAQQGPTTGAGRGTSTVTIGDGISTPVLNVSGGNLETANEGRGIVTMNSGTYNQTSNNLIVGQRADSEATFIMNGGVILLNNLLRIANRGDGDGTGQKFILNDGQVNVGSRLDIGNLDNEGAVGVLEVHGGALNVGTDLIVGNVGDGKGTVTQDGGTVNVGTGAGGDLILANGGDVDSEGTYNLLGGTLDLGGNDITAGSPGTAVFNFVAGALRNVGTFDATNLDGTMAGTLDQQGGLLAAGASPGIMNMTGDYNLGSAGTLEVEIASGGDTPGVDFDFYDITGDATLDGTLDIVSFGGFEIPPFQDFEVMEAETITLLGNFNVNGGFAQVIDLDSGRQALLVFTPEPATFAIWTLLGLAMAGVGFVRFRRRK